MIPKNEHRCLERRRRRRWQRKEEEKKLRALMREFHRLQRAAWNAPFVELPTPYQRGWQRTFHLTVRARRRPDVRALELLLKQVDVRQFCWRKDFQIGYCRRTDRPRILRHQLRRLDLEKFLKARIPERLFKYFRVSGGFGIITRRTLRELCGRGWNGRFEVNCPDLFESVVEPCLITHQRVDMPEVKRRLDEIEAILDGCDGWDRYWRLRGHRVSCWDWIRGEPRQKMLEHFADSEIRGVLREADVPIADASEIPTIDNSEQGTMRIVPFSFSDFPFSQAA